MSGYRSRYPETIKVYGLKLPGRDPRVIGKLVRLSPTTLVLWRKFEKGQMRNLADSLSFDEGLLDAIKADGALWIDYGVSKTLMYRISVGDFEANPIRKNNGEGWQLYVPPELWIPIPFYDTPYRNTVDQIIYPRRDEPPARGKAAPTPPPAPPSPQMGLEL